MINDALQKILRAEEASRRHIDARRKKIESMISMARTAVQKSRQEQLKEAEAMKRRLLAGAHKEALEKKEQILNEAKIQAQDIVDQGRACIEPVSRRVFDELLKG
ncbi:MAG: hypothetical protein KGK03_10950 [Candidatus Omnitrophica bacterium]|nr:hypothetical protein [Candidatus Omnitrophota bacterium]MDE2223574.1 hypothetical protein [Candidatus Omnitrophota bacterium]